MCRISGVFSTERNKSSIIEAVYKMNTLMAHGGPDDEGIYIDSEYPLVLGHRRLSLLDLSELGHQPMQTERFLIFFNGEVYNYIELKNALLNHGYTFNSSTDTEVILKAFEFWGPRCFQYFIGMFALVILDKTKHKLYIARNASSIKPLYLYVKGNTIAFSSEIRAFKQAFFDFAEYENWKTLFLIFGHLPEPYTTLKHVQTLPAGEYWTIDLSTSSNTKAQFEYYGNKQLVNTPEEGIYTVKQTLDKAIERQLICDAPVGIFLSGGLDSSILAVSGSKAIAKPLHTISIAFEEQNYDERYYQQLVSKRINSIHHEIIISKNDFLSQLPNYLKALDQPTVNSINSYIISKYTQSLDIKAVLSGIGADELFDGYPSSQTSLLMRRFFNLHKWLFSYANNASTYKFKKAEYLQLSDYLGRYLFFRSGFSPSTICFFLIFQSKKSRGYWSNFISQIKLKTNLKAKLLHGLRQICT